MRVSGGVRRRRRGVSRRRRRGRRVLQFASSRLRPLRRGHDRRARLTLRRCHHRRCHHRRSHHRRPRTLHRGCWRRCHFRRSHFRRSHDGRPLQPLRRPLPWSLTTHRRGIRQALRRSPLACRTPFFNGMSQVLYAPLCPPRPLSKMGGSKPAGVPRGCRKCWACGAYCWCKELWCNCASVSSQD